jgi:hypothetical protein
MTRPKPPFDRLKEQNILKDNVQLQFEDLRNQTNPLALCLQIDDLIAHLFLLSALGLSETVNVFEILIKEEIPSVTVSFDLTGIQLHPHSFLPS